MATTATPSPQLTSDCSSNSASPEPAVPVIQSAYRIGTGGSEPPGDADDTDVYEEFDEEPKSDYSSDRETIGAN